MLLVQASPRASESKEPSELVAFAFLLAPFLVRFGFCELPDLRGCFPEKAALGCCKPEAIRIQPGINQTTPQNNHFTLKIAYMVGTKIM